MALRRGMIFKVIQRQTLTCLSHRYGIYFAFAGFVIVIYALLQFGEELMIWSQSQYDSMFSFYHDNIAGNSYQNQLCSPIPIDVVYTWVNGSDAKLIQALNNVMMSSKMDQSVENTTTANYENQPMDCNLQHCITLPCVIVPKLFEKSLFNIGNIISHFDLRLKDGFFFSSKENATILRFEDTSAASKAIKEVYSINETIAKWMQVTSESNTDNSQILSNGFIISNIPGKLDNNQLIDKLPIALKNNFDWIHMQKAKNTAFIWAKEPESILQIINAKQDSNKLEIDNQVIDINQAYLVDLNTNLGDNNEASKSRFEDNEELRYSLRSIEKYAPWVRHIYIVTNGQVPHWLNLDNPRVSIITHEEIYPNKSHLPSFSSPSIESHLHRIPNLSQKFIYFNDDVMFGKEVWPDDFYTHSFGQKVYLTWSVPNCAEGCAPTWIKDGFCDNACNVSECMWDGGNCVGKNVRAGIGSNNFDNSYTFSSTYCRSGCSNSWLADKYCDQACNYAECGFDAGDCGVGSFDKLYLLSTDVKNGSVYHIPPSLTVAYIDIKKTFDEVTSASYDKNAAVRVAAVSNVHRTLMLLFYKESNFSSTMLNLTGSKIDDFNVTRLSSVVFNVTSDPSMNITFNISQTKTETKDVVVGTSKTDDQEDELYIVDVEVAVDEKVKKPKKSALLHTRKFKPLKLVNESALPTEVQNKFTELQLEFENGLITQNGFYKKAHDILKGYPDSYQVVKETNSNHVQLENSTDHVKGDVFEVTTQEQVHSIQMLRKNIQDEKNKVHERNNQSMNIIGGLRKLLSFESDFPMLDFNGFLPWEGEKKFETDLREIIKMENKEKTNSRYSTNTQRVGRRLLQDNFAQSLRYVSNIYNRDFGFSQRSVPAHMPHMIDRSILKELQASYPEEFERTSSHKLRHPEDMQYAFSYFYYLMEKKEDINITRVFNVIDNDASGILSDRELRVLATQLHDLPLTLEELTNMEQSLINCAWRLYSPNQDENATIGVEQRDISKLNQPLGDFTLEQYYDAKMPMVTKHLIENCDEIMALMNKTYANKNKYKFQKMDQEEVAFKMIQSNVSVVVGQLDSIRKKPRKFICLNDNIDHNSKEAKLVKAVLADFYETLFPIPSQFELPPEYRNRFATKTEIMKWQKQRDQVSLILRLLLFVLVILTIWSFLWDHIYDLWKKHKYRFGRGRNPFIRIWKYFFCNTNERSPEFVP